MFGELVARWQERQLGTPISVVVEFQPDVVRIIFRHPQTPLTPAAWEELISPIVLDYVDSWGIDRGRAGNAWFEFRDPDIATRIATQPQRKHRRQITGRADLSPKARPAAAN